MIKATKLSQIQRTWHLVDAKDQVLGRLATRITPLLMGKTKPYFIQNLDCGDHVVVINARDVRVTGKKEQEKKYYRYSGYPGGLKATTFSQLKEKSPEKIILNAIKNMLPKNRLRDLWLQRLHIFAGNVHPYEEKFTPLPVNKKLPKPDLQK